MSLHPSMGAFFRILIIIATQIACANKMLFWDNKRGPLVSRTSLIVAMRF